MAVEEMDGDVYLLTGQALKWHCIGTCLPVMCSRGGFWLCKGGEDMRLTTRCIFVRRRCRQALCSFKAEQTTRLQPIL